MGDFRLLNYEGAGGAPRPALLVGDDIRLPGISKQVDWEAEFAVVIGRPRGIFLKPGDHVRIEIGGIGVLENPVVQGE